MSLLSLPTGLTASAAALGKTFSAEAAPASDTTSSGSPSFAQTLLNAFGQVNGLQNHAGQMAQSFAQGKTSDIHTVMIASEQASLALQLTTQIRNKAVDAYQEIMRISM